MESIQLLCDVLRNARKQQGLSRAQLADGICSVHSLSYYESAYSTPLDDKALKLAVCLGIDTDEFLLFVQRDRKELAELRRAAWFQDYRTMQTICVRIVYSTTTPSVKRRFAYFEEFSNRMLNGKRSTMEEQVYM